MRQIDLLTQILSLVIDSKVCPDTDVKKWAKIIMDAHVKGYLYCVMDKEEVVTAVCAYRVESWDEKFTKDMPANEFGTKLYVAWVASRNKQKTGLLNLLRNYMNYNFIDELIYYRRNSDTDFRRIKLNKELNYVEA